VGDELQLVVVANPDFNRLVKVLPDGSITAPGAGTLHVLGMTAEETAAKLESSLGRLLRFPDVDVIVATYGDHVVYVMGEVTLPGDHIYRKGMSALQALAAAGGFKDSGKRNSVLVFRRIGLHEAELHKIDLEDPLEGRGSLDVDMVLHPYDIVYVPKTWIADVNVFVDQWFRQNLSALTFYLTGWDAYSVTTDRVVITRENR
jgi:polysaccharide export outer membrane protein